MAAPLEKCFKDTGELVVALAARITDQLAGAITAGREASLVVSGGRTPAQLFARLAQTPIDWPRVAISLADERWVPVNVEASNEAMVRRTLLQGHAAGARFVGLKRGATRAAAGASEAFRAIATLPHPFDVVVLGMGDDGHTASLFPDSPKLDDALAPSSPPACVAMRAPVAPFDRLSLNLAALLDARLIVIHLQGEAKWPVYQQALQPGPAREMPVRAVLRQQHIPVEVYWSS